ncbi:glycerol kinase GlpK [Lutimonas zeaxanthinifaciens]|uniref:glycerol kinase GlpK n=1 Tax=Lutimonas zeaxanthinifaciens TaxID=3060215 RepID=UPI00265D00F5|nr:glycerol kinase GlpK [Lutimonas sp. YSD2104]WKK66306.1 glycerol kinase GlpK [Lutimonas sp. YSD2104]
MAKKYILALDQGTTSSRTVLFDDKGKICGIAQRETEQIYPEHGWVEQNAVEIYQSQLETMHKVIRENDIGFEDILSIGITNQRETTVVWNKKTGEPVYNAIVWQDVRTSKYCKELKKDATLKTYIQENTGLVIDSYFSATKVKWILDNVPKARKMAEKNELLFGTVDTWLLWNLTKGNVHATDYSNASRTMLYNIVKLDWDQHLLNKLEIPASMLPQVKSSNFHYGNFEFDNYKIPVTGIAGDQQAALFGQACFEKGEIKNTYGTGCFLLMNTGSKPKFSEHGLLTTIAWGLDGKIDYALEGSVFIAGAAIQWLRDGLQLIDNAKDSEYFAKQVKEDSSVYVVPAFAGLGAPYWDMDARGSIFGLTRDTGKNHLIKATLESLAYRSKDLIVSMEEDSGVRLTALKVDGGACANNYLMQFQADILDTPVERAEIIESTALGAAYLSGIGVGLWKKEDILKNRKIEKEFQPKMDESKRKKLYATWKKAVSRSMDWED